MYPTRCWKLQKSHEAPRKPVHVIWAIPLPASTFQTGPQGGAGEAGARARRGRPRGSCGCAWIAPGASIPRSFCYCPNNEFLGELEIFEKWQSSTNGSSGALKTKKLQTRKPLKVSRRSGEGIKPLLCRCLGDRVRVVVRSLAWPRGDGEQPALWGQIARLLLDS